MAKKKTSDPPGYDEKVAAELWRQCVEKVQAEIQRQGLTQMQIAVGTGISQPTVSRFIAKGEITLERLLILMDFLGFEWVMRPKNGGREKTEKVKHKRSQSKN